MYPSCSVGVFPRTRWPSCLAAVFTSLVLILAGCGTEPTSAPTTPSGPELAKRPSVQAEHRLVLLRQGVTADLRRTIEQLGGTIERAHPEIGVLSVRGLSDRAAARLAALPQVEGVARDRRMQWIPPTDRLTRAAPKRLRTKTDQRGAFFFERFQWNLRVIQADDAWLTTPQGAGALVCVLDTGIDPNHLDLAGKVDLAKSASFVPDEPSFVDFFFHGTFVAALISSNGIGMGSVAPDARLCAVKVLDRTGSGSFEWIVAGILHAGNVGADVINMSFSAVIPTEDLRDSRAEIKELIKATQRAIDYARKRGTLSVAAASNDALNRNTKEFIVLPADLHQVVSVGATAPVGQTNFDRVASYSNYGKREVDVFAPGGDLVEGGVIEDLILSACASSTTLFDLEFCTTSNDWYIFAAGTSAAAPHVSGEAAVIESSFPGDQSAERLEHCILVSADRITGIGRDPVYGKGRINVLGGAECRRLK
jgi:lantibiotic leader peptide-processing serine protease